MRGSALVAALLLASCAEAPAEPVRERPAVGLITALPLLWGEADIGELLAGGGRRAPALALIDQHFTVEPIDAVTAETLRRHRLLLIAQPPVASPQELVALDGWVRAGGRALILADPLLAWDSRYGLGDPRRPPPVHGLDRLLTHWGVAIDPAAAADKVIDVGGRAITTTTPGRLRRIGGRCAVAPFLARCRLGRGEVLIVPDADMLDEGHVEGQIDGNVDAIVALLGSLAPREGRGAQPPDSG